MTAHGYPHPIHRFINRVVLTHPQQRLALAVARQTCGSRGDRCRWLTYARVSDRRTYVRLGRGEGGRSVAVVDDLGHSGMDVPPPSEDFGRQPPQDAAAEQAVLGGMLLSKDAIADVLERLRPGDFYRPAHQNVYDAILDLYGRGEPADAVTVAAELDRRGLLRRIGGAPYLHTLISTVPTAANAGFYAGIVAEKALLRRLVEAGTRVVQYGYAGAEGADVTEIVDRAQAEIYDVTEGRTS